MTIDIDFSPIKGPEGNIEYLLHMKNTPRTDTTDQDSYTSQAMTDDFHGVIDNVVKLAHDTLE